MLTKDLIENLTIATHKALTVEQAEEIAKNFMLIYNLNKEACTLDDMYDILSKSITIQKMKARNTKTYELKDIVLFISDKYFDYAVGTKLEDTSTEDYETKFSFGVHYKDSLKPFLVMNIDRRR